MGPLPCTQWQSLQGELGPDVWFVEAFSERADGHRSKGSFSAFGLGITFPLTPYYVLGPATLKHLALSLTGDGVYLTNNKSPSCVESTLQFTKPFHLQAKNEKPGLDLKPLRF